MINIKNVFILTSALVIACPFSNSFAQEANSAPVLVSAPVVPASEANAPAAAYTIVEEQGKPAILLKINNVKSVKNKDGLITSCDFDAIVYNRSTSKISGAAVDLSWKDEAAAAALIDEAERKKEREAREAQDNTISAAARNARAARAARTSTARSARANAENEYDPNVPDLVFTLDIPEVESYGQAVITSKLKSDKCFLLVQDAEISVRSCNATAPQENENPVVKSTTRLLSSSTGNSGNSGCVAMFEYISSKDPQYYRDFKKIDPESEKLARLSRQELIKQEVEADYQRALQAMDAIAKELDNIK